MDKVKRFLNGFERGTRAQWCRDHGLDPIRIAQIAGGHKGVGLSYAQKIIDASDGQLGFDDFRPESDAGDAQQRTATQ